MTPQAVDLVGCSASNIADAAILRTSAQIEGYSSRRERCAEKKAWDSEPACGTAMRVIARFSGPCAAAALTSRGSVFSHDFKGLARLPKLATSYQASGPPEVARSGCV